MSFEDRNSSFLELSEVISTYEVEGCEDEIYAHGRAQGNLYLVDGEKEIYEETNVRIVCIFYF